MDRPTRKPNRLTGYDYSQPGCYFVTICTKGKRHILGRVVGGDVLIAPQMILSAMGQVVDDQLAKMPLVDQYVVMPNHVHVIFQIPADGPVGTPAPTQKETSTSLPQLVRYLKRRVTQQLGQSIWQRGYHDHIIRNDADYLRIWDYIHTNPAKWREDCYFTETEE